MKIKELGHLVLYVRNIERSAHFYETVLGWHRLPSPPHIPVALFSGGRTHHELLLIEVGEDATPIPQGHRIGLYHFGLKIGDTIDELKTAMHELETQGISYAGTDHTVTNSLYIADPDGNEIELYIDVPGIDWKNEPELLLRQARPLIV